MVAEHEDLQYIDDPAADLQETRSLDAIRRDVADLEERDLTHVTADLEKARRSLAMNLSGVEEAGDAWRSLVDEFEPNLDHLEREAIGQLEGMRTRVLQDRDAITDLPYRCDLPAEQRTAAESRAATLAARLPNMSAVDVQRGLRGATLFGDPIDQAAWAMIGPDLEARFPATTKVRDEQGREGSPAQLFQKLMRQCEHATGDRTVLETQDRLEGQLRKLNQTITAITQARNQHNPTGGVGGVLASHQFGRPGGAEQVRQARRYDPDAVRRRVGRAN